MTESQAWAEIEQGDTAAGLNALQWYYYYQWVPGTHDSGFQGYSYSRWNMNGGGIASLVTRQRAFEINGGTSGEVGTILDWLGDAAGGTEPGGVPGFDGTDPEGGPLPGIGLLSGFPWWILVVVAVFITLDE